MLEAVVKAKAGVLDIDSGNVSLPNLPKNIAPVARPPINELLDGHKTRFNSPNSEVQE